MHAPITIELGGVCAARVNIGNRFYGCWYSCWWCWWGWWWWGYVYTGHTVTWCTPQLHITVCLSPSLPTCLTEYGIASSDLVNYILEKLPSIEDRGQTDCVDFWPWPIPSTFNPRRAIHYITFIHLLRQEDSIKNTQVCIHIGLSINIAHSIKEQFSDSKRVPVINS